MVYLRPIDLNITIKCLATPVHSAFSYFCCYVGFLTDYLGCRLSHVELFNIFSIENWKSFDNSCTNVLSKRYDGIQIWRRLDHPIIKVWVVMNVLYFLFQNSYKMKLDAKSTSLTFCQAQERFCTWKIAALPKRWKFFQDVWFQSQWYFLYHQIKRSYWLLETSW